MILTKNEKKILRFLVASTGKNQSMNDVGKACNVTSGGAFKILTKLEKEGVLQATHISNIKAYKLNFESEKTENVLRLAFIPDNLEGRVKFRAEDLKPLRTTTQACVLFGSYTTTKEKPGDLDVLFVLEKKNFKAYKQALTKAKDLIPIKVQDVIQTIEDLEQNLKKGDPIIVGVLRNGIMLWGFDVLVQVIKNASK